MKKWYESSAENVSAMRIFGMIVVITGSLAVIAGIIAMFLNNQYCVGVVTAGAGMTASANIMKGIQKKDEK